MSSPQKAQGAGAFDIRRIIALLMGVYGAVITVMGIGFTSDEEIAKSAGVNINLWAGIGMLIFSGLFFLWAWLRPIRVDEGPDTEQHEAGHE